MCVIAYGRKSHFKTDWFQQCCDHNPDGFFVARANTGEHIRTLKYEEALAFFEDSKSNDRIVLHARIKSVGPVNANNVHGWEDSGLRFCHNGTLSLNVKDNLTDSETIFRQVIAPLYRANRNKMTKALKSAIEVLVGTSRFLIIDRQGRVYTFGKFTEKEGCLFSNMFWDASLSKMSWYEDYYGISWNQAKHYVKPATNKTDGTPAVTTPTYSTTPPSTKLTFPLPKPKAPGSILPPRLLLSSLLKHFGKSGINATMLSQILPAHTFISAMAGASRYNETALSTYLKAARDTGSEADETLRAHLKVIRASATTERDMPTTVRELRRWLKDYALVVLSALRPLVTDDLYYHIRGVLGLMLKFADGTVPESYLEALAQVSLYSTVCTGCLASRGVYLPDVFYILYNLHVAIGRCYVSLPIGASFPQESDKQIALFNKQLSVLSRSSVFDFLTDVTLDPLETLECVIDSMIVDAAGTYISVIKAFPHAKSPAYGPIIALPNVTNGLTTDAVDRALYPCSKVDETPPRRRNKK